MAGISMTKTQLYYTGTKVQFNKVHLLIQVTRCACFTTLVPVLACDAVHQIDTHYAHFTKSALASVCVLSQHSIPDGMNSTSFSFFYLLHNSVPLQKKPKK